VDQKSLRQLAPAPAFGYAGPVLAVLFDGSAQPGIALRKAKTA